MGIAPGLDQINSLQKGGFSSDEIQAWKADTAKTLQDAGFSGQELDEYFGHKEPDMAPTKAIIKQNLEARGTPAPTPAPAQTGEAKPVSPQQHAANGVIDAFEAGWQTSVAGLIKRGQMPDTVLPEHAPMFHKIASMVGQIAGDFPAMVAGGAAGAEVGASTGAVVGGGIGAVAGGVGAIPGLAIGGAVGGIAGGGAGAWAAPAMMRKAIIDHYEKGDIKDAEDFLARSGAVIMEGMKSGAVGAATALSGPIVGGATKFAGPVISKLAATTAEIGTMTTLSKAVEGELPNYEDFVTGAIMVGGMHAAEAVSGKLMTIYKETGIKPSMVAEHAANDPVLKGELLSNDPSVPTAYKDFVEATPLKAGEEAPPQPKLIKVEDSGTFGKTNSSLNAEPAPELKIEPMPEAKPTKVEDVSRSDAEKAVLDRISPSKDKESNLSVDQLRTQFIDSQHWIGVFTKAVADGELPTIKDPQKMARLLYGNKGRGDRWIDFGPVKFDLNEENTFQPTGAKSLRSILDPFKDDLDGFRAYAVSKRAVELEGQGIKTGVPVEEAKAVVKAGNSKYSQAIKDIQEYRKAGIDYLVDSGVLSRENADNFMKASESYVPFYRLMEDSAGGKGKGSTVSNPIKSMKGSDRQIIDPVESLIKDTYSFIAIAERNRVMRNIVDIAEKNPEAAAEWITKKPTPMKSIEVTDKEVAKFMKEHNLEGDPASFNIFRPDSKTLAADEISMYRDGKREIYKLDPDLAGSIKSLDRGSATILTKVLGKMASSLRTGTTLSPEFALRNPIRDQWTSFIVSRNNYVPIYDAIKGLGSLLPKDEHYQNWLSGGGAQGTLMSMDHSYIQDNIFKLSKETGLMDKTWNVVKSPIEAMKVLSETTEHMTRLGEYRKGIANGQDPFGAAFESRDLLDFARAGAKVQAVKGVIAFWNANLQGKERLFRALQENPVGTTAKAVASVTIPSILTYIAGKDDKRMEDVPAWQKDMFWVIPTDKWEDVNNSVQMLPPEHLTRVVNGKLQVNNGAIYRIPKPQETGILYGSSVERTLDAYFKENPDAFHGFAKNVMKSFDMEYIPTGVVPILEHINNKSNFTGRSIVPAAMEKVLPEYQYTEYTSETAKQLGKMTAAIPGMKFSSFASPAIIDNYVRGWSGTLGQYALQLSDKALVKSGVIPEPLKPASTLSDLPVIKAFVVRYPTAGPESIQIFNEKYDENSKVMESIKLQAHRGKFDDVMREFEYGQAESKLNNLSGIREGIHNMQKYIQNISQDPEMTPNDKRQLIDAVYMHMSEEAKIANKTLNEVEKSLRKK